MPINATTLPESSGNSKVRGVPGGKGCVADWAKTYFSLSFCMGKQLKLCFPLGKEKIEEEIKGLPGKILRHGAFKAARIRGMATTKSKSIFWMSGGSLSHGTRSGEVRHSMFLGPGA